MALVRIDNVTEEELDEAVRKLEEEERWQKENPEKHRLITQLWTTIYFLEKMIAELRGK